MCLLALVPVTAQEADLAVDWPPPVYDLSGTVSVTGTVNPADLRSFYLEAGEYDPADPEAEPFWTPVTLPRREPVVAGLLGEWDTTIFSDGLYELRVRVLLTTGESRFLVVSRTRTR